jgi:hypothetical protein
MKPCLIFILKIFLLLPAFAPAANPRFYIMTSGNQKGTAVYESYIESCLFKELKKHFPCADYSDESTITAILELERQKQLLGAGDDDALANIAGAMGCEYLVGCNVLMNGNSLSISLFCMENKRARTIARAGIQSGINEAGLDAVESVCKELVEGLKEYEICPFTGPIIVEVNSSIKTSKTDTYEVYCNGGDGLYKKVTDTDKTSHMLWQLEKTAKFTTSGSVEYQNSEIWNVEEQNDCFICNSGRKGPRMYTENVKATARVEGLSNESISEGQQIEDARTQIIFKSDGTYFVEVKAASKKGDLIEKVTRHSEGTCDNIRTPPETNIRKADIPLKQTFGPFSGTSLDKALTANDSFTVIDPITEEKTIYTFEFNLRRE